MRTALETFFLNIPHSHRIFPEDDPKANALGYELLASHQLRL